MRIGDTKEKTAEMSHDVFRPDQSELERNPEKVHQYVQLLEAALGHGFRVVGILEIGSFAKGEAVPSSDIDTRVYISSEVAYARQTDSSRYKDRKKDEHELRHDQFVIEKGDKPWVEYNWYEFNEEYSRRFSEELGCNVEFGLVDSRYAAYELEHLDTNPVREHALLLQSNILYDPSGCLEEKRKSLSMGVVVPRLASYYETQFLSGVPFDLLEHIKPHAADAYKAEKNSQIQWVNRAVKYLRNAVASKTYTAFGNFIYKREGVLDFYRRYLPEEVAFVDKIYEWKCDPQIRTTMIHEFAKDPTKFFSEFEKMNADLERIVQKVRAIEFVS